MITTSGRTTGVLKALDNWKPNRLLQRSRTSIMPPAFPPATVPAVPAVMTVPAPGMGGLEATLSRHGPLPQQTAILGVTTDGAPLLLDLADPSPGALLIAGNDVSAKTRLLQAILASIIRINRPGQAEIRIIAREPAQFDHFFPAEHCRQILSSDDPAAGEAIVELLPAIGPSPRGTADWGTRSMHRPYAGRRAQAVILAVDDLEALVARLDKQAFASLCWLARHGARLRVWLIATQSTYQQVDELLLSAFHTCLVEHPDNDGAGGQGNQFWLPLEEQAVPFWICEPEYQEGWR